MIRTIKKFGCFEGALLALALAVGGCGFHLRGMDHGDLPAEMRQLYITGVRSGMLVNALNEYLGFSNGRVTPDPKTAQLVLNILDEDMDRRELALSESGKANEYELIYNLRFELKNIEGETVLPLQELEIRRDYFNPQVDVVGKGEEEQVLRNEIYQEAARAILRRAEIVLSKKAKEASPAANQATVPPPKTSPKAE